MILYILSALCCLIVAQSAQTTPHGAYILPTVLTPLDYDVKLIYDIDAKSNYSFYGVVDILLNCKEATSNIILHAKSFDLKEDGVKVTGANPVVVKKADINPTYDFLTIKLGESLAKGENYTVRLPFSGNLMFGLDGVYLSQYKNKKTEETEYLIATQFEAVSARKGFPCFDEPLYKAPFKLTIGHQKGYSAISNMPEYKSIIDNVMEDVWQWSEIEKKFNKPKDAFVWDEFQTSVPMSTYLVAFLVSKFGHVVSPADLSKAQFRVWARQDALQQTEYASITGPKVLSFFEKWFKVPYPLPKQDMVAIPDFAAGAMENWGLITYRETTLLYDEKESSFMAKERVAEVVAHELAHQWFGNLVTMKWWSDLWLNEGFATFAAAVGMREAHPEWRPDVAAAVDNMQTVLALDALATSHPVSVSIDNPYKISEIFDTIAYRKGANLIRMMTMFLGEDVFREGIHNYLVKHSYQNAEQDDLWQELTDVSSNVLSRNVTVKQIMDTWTTQTGYPLLNVTRNYNDGSLTVTQKRFLSLQTDMVYDSAWWVPLNLVLEKQKPDDKAKTEWLSDTEGTNEPFTIRHGASNDEWLLLNRDMIGLYRTNYDSQNWDMIIKMLNSKQYDSMPELSRVQVIEDAFALATKDIVSYEKALSLVTYIRYEKELFPMETALSALSRIESLLLRTKDYGTYQKFVRGLITDIYYSSGGLYSKKIQNDDDLNSVKLQVMVSRWACRMKVDGCEENAIEMFDQWMTTSDPDVENPIPLDLRSTVYCVAMKRGSLKQWKFLYDRYKKANVAAAKSAAMIALTCSKEISILHHYLELTLNLTEVRAQDVPSVISSIARNDVGFYIAKDFISHRLLDIMAAIGGQSRRLGTVVQSVVRQYTMQGQLDDFLEWKTKNSKHLEESKQIISQAIERANVNINWMKKNAKNVVTKMNEFSLKMEKQA